MNLPRLLAIALLLFSAGACSKSHEHSPAAAAHAHSHAHTAPHGGTAVVLGDEAYHLEFVHDAATGTLTAYILDAHMENFIRSDVPSFELTTTAGGENRSLVFRPVANTATGETVGNTSQFETQADWLKKSSSFDATLKSLRIRGTVFENVSFSFPEGNAGR